jgi:Cys-tRNA(Pro)/Cys-tRNA(Cys) deacylase
MNNVLTLHRSLLENDIRHEIVRLPRAISSADQLPETLALPAHRCIAVRIYEVDDQHAALIVAPDLIPPLPVVRQATGGRRVRAATEETVSSVTGYAAGLVAPVALPAGLPVYVDQEVADSAGDGTVVYTATGESGTALGIGLADLLACCAAKPAALAGRQ